jgi:nicotinamide phosphoribosyltransferase
MKTSILLNADSYKFSQFNQYPEGTEYVYSYIESRGGKYDTTVFFGLQAFIYKHLLHPIVMSDIDEAEEVITAHGLPFNREGWEYILNTYDGYLPVEIKAVPEGSVVPTHNVLLSIMNTDPKCYWLTSFLETALLRAVWYPTTVATNSREIKKVILDALERTGDPSTIGFKLHDFGYRGVSSEESAGLGGLAHLVNFQGTDTVAALLYGRRYYGIDMAGFSIPAMEHSTVTSWGREHEADSFRNMIQKNAKPGGIVACVSDSYDIFNACEMWGTELKQDVIDSGATIVIRPDSGDPAQVVSQCACILAAHFGTTTNDKGYEVLNNVRIIQGDGINIDSVTEILETLEDLGFSADNIAFGMGGALLQGVTRDDQRFAMKCSAARINGEWIDVFKDPITDSGKRSKKGILKLVKDAVNGYDTLLANSEDTRPNQLSTVFANGHVGVFQPFDIIRERAKI